MGTGKTIKRKEKGNEEVKFEIDAELGSEE